MSDTYSGGVWTSTATSVATLSVIDGTDALLTGISDGATVISYSGSGCYRTGNANVVGPFASITGTNYVCKNASTSLNDAVAGGAWRSSNTSTATVGAFTGVATGVAAGTTVISYGAYGCFVTTPITVNNTPASITGTAYLCASGTTTLNDATGGGTWSSNSPGNATIGSSNGVVTGAASGSTTISYTLSSTGCYNTQVVTVNPCREANESNMGGQGVSDMVQNYSLYPNPTSGTINFEQAIVEDKQVSVKIYNYLGEIIFDDKLNFNGGSSKLNLSKVSPGIYLVNIQLDENSKQVFKIMVQ
jgi:hypothetical protein